MNLIKDSDRINSEALINAKKYLVAQAIDLEASMVEGSVRLLSSFPQMWGSTALGFSGRIGGQAMTTALTSVMVHLRTGTFIVAFHGRIAYHLSSPTAAFWDDISQERVANTQDYPKYLGKSLPTHHLKAISKDMADCSGFMAAYSTVNESVQERLRPELNAHCSKLMNHAAELVQGLTLNNFS